MSNETIIPFRKIDLHIHTPYSECYGDVSVTAEQVVDAAQRAGIEAIGITDHNTFEAVDDIRRIAEGTDLTVFPGVELTTAGGHVLVLFDVASDPFALRSFLEIVGLDSDKWGDPASQTAGDTIDVLKKVVTNGGLAIAAHVERWPSGFLKKDGPRRARMDIHACDDLAALEITIPEDRRQWNEGAVRGYPKRYACIQGSDAHALDEIGRRPVFVRVKQLDLAGIRQALHDHETSLAFPGDFSPCA